MDGPVRTYVLFLLFFDSFANLRFQYVDIRSPIVRSLIEARLDLAVSKGCDGVEPDNVDEYQNSNGLGITAADQIDFNSFVAGAAHARGLSVGLKNDLDQVKSLVGDYDWALDEQCNQYSECASLNPFVTAGKAVFGVEYSGSARYARFSILVFEFRLTLSFQLFLPQDGYF